MDQRQLFVEELKIADSLNFHLALHSVDDLVTEEECRGAVSTITDFYNEFRRIHVELKSEMGEEEYDKKYPHVGARNDKVTEYLKAVKVLIRDKSSARQESKGNEEFQGLIIEADFLVRKMSKKRIGFILLTKTVMIPSK